jgi:hypothetical protein
MENRFHMGNICRVPADYMVMQFAMTNAVWHAAKKLIDVMARMRLTGDDLERCLAGQGSFELVARYAQT